MTDNHVPASAGEEERQRQDRRRKWAAMLGVGLGVFMATLDTSIVNIALPTLSARLKADFATVQWVALSYLLVLTALMLGAARLGDLYGKKRLYIIGLVLFTLSSLLCGLARDVYALIAFRALQGVGSVFMAALGTAIVTEVFPATERGKAMGVIGGVVSLGIALGPAIGGLLMARAGWPSIFLVNIPIGAIALFITLRVLPPGTTPARRERFDIAGATVATAALLCYALGMTHGQQAGFDDPLTLLLLGLSALGLATFLWLERRVAAPMIDLSLFQNARFRTNLAMGFLVFIVIAGYALLMPFYLERVGGYDTTHTGLLMTAVPILMGLLAPVSGSLSDRFGTERIILAGLLVLIVGCLALATLSLNTSTVGFLLRVAPMGIGFGLFQSPNNSAIMGAAPRARLGIASGLLSLSRTLGQTTGFPLMGAIFASRVLALSPVGSDASTADAAAAPPPLLVQGIQVTFFISAAILLVAALLAVISWRKESPRLVP